MVKSIEDNNIAHEKAYNDILSAIEKQISINKKRLYEIEYKSDSLEFEYIMERVNRDKDRAQENYERYMKWLTSLPKDIQKIAEKFVIYSSRLTGGIAGAYDYDMNFVNFTPKTIKYLYWFGRVKNSVGDYISCEATGASTFSGRFAGPVSPYRTGFAAWEYVIFNGESDKMVLSSVKLIYTDGSSLTVDSKVLKYFSDYPPEDIDKFGAYFRSPYEGLSDEELKHHSDFASDLEYYRKSLLREKYPCEVKIKHWESTKRDVIHYGLWNDMVPAMMPGIYGREKNKEIQNELTEYDNTKKIGETLQTKLRVFKEMNLVED